MIVKAEAGVSGRLDAFLAENIEHLSRSAAQMLIEKGCVLYNGVPAKKSQKVSPGDCFEVELPEPEKTDIVPENISLDIVYEDDDVIVVNKPKGMVVHPSHGHWSGTLVNALMYSCGDRLSGIGGQLRPGIVHRIDKDTSGLLIVAKNDFAHLSLSEQLKDRSLSREYDAIVCGRVREDSGSINAPIGRHPLDRKKMAVTDKNSKEAITDFEVVTRYRQYTHIRCRLRTGRTHQIRVHMAYCGHPVLGDAVYGKKKSEFGLEGQCLNATRLKFVHPRTGEHIELEIPLPEYFTDVLNKLVPEDS